MVIALETRMTKLSPRQVERLDIIESLSPMEAEYVIDLGTEDGLLGKLARRLYPMAHIEGCDIYDTSAAAMPEEYDYWELQDAHKFATVATALAPDLIYCCELLEHMTKEEGRDLIRLCRETGATCIFTTPLGWMPQDAIKGNPYQKHVSAWDPSDFADADTVITDSEHSILAVKYRSTV